MKQILDYFTEKKFERNHPIMEMAAVSCPEDQLPDKTRICVFPENDEQGTKTPHFHIRINDTGKNTKAEFEIYINHIHELKIWRAKNKKYQSWDGFANVKKAVLEWLDKKSYDFKELTNVELIVRTWNVNNSSNRVDVEYTK